MIKRGAFPEAPWAWAKCVGSRSGRTPYVSIVATVRAACAQGRTDGDYEQQGQNYQGAPRNAIASPYPAPSPAWHPAGPGTAAETGSPPRSSSAVLPPAHATA